MLPSLVWNKRTPEGASGPLFLTRKASSSPHKLFLLLRYDLPVIGVSQQ